MDITGLAGISAALIALGAVEEVAGRQPAAWDYRSTS
jgi:hypothetical protein